MSPTAHWLASLPTKQLALPPCANRHFSCGNVGFWSLDFHECTWPGLEDGGGGDHLLLLLYWTLVIDGIECVESTLCSKGYESYPQSP